VVVPRSASNGSSRPRTCRAAAAPWRQMPAAEARADARCCVGRRRLRGRTPWPFRAPRAVAPRRRCAPLNAATPRLPGRRRTVEADACRRSTSGRAVLRGRAAHDGRRRARRTAAFGEWRRGAAADRAGGDGDGRWAVARWEVAQWRWRPYQALLCMATN
jgi:hypothetical protein